MSAISDNVPVWKNRPPFFRASPKKSLSQNFLVSEQVIDKIIESAQLGPGKITELGAGRGAITKALLTVGLQVRAIEKDDSLLDWASNLPREERGGLKLVKGDLKQSDWSWEVPYQIIGNIPYQLSGLIIRKLVQLGRQPAQAILLLQREVAQRLVATPPNGQLIGLAVQLWGEAKLVMKVPPHAFSPAPNVASSLVLLKPHDKELLPVTERERVLDIAGVFFRGRRKQMAGVLRRWRGLGKQEAEQLLGQAGIMGEARPQEVNVEEWVRLAQEITLTPDPSPYTGRGEPKQ